MCSGQGDTYHWEGCGNEHGALHDDDMTSAYAGPCRLVEPEAQDIIDGLAEEMDMNRTRLPPAQSNAVTISGHPQFGLNGHRVRFCACVKQRGPASSLFEA